MSGNFITATHLLAYLTYVQDRAGRASSKEIAAQIQTSPVVVRRVMQQLTAAGLVHTHLGTNGGTSLARPAARISLLDIFEAVRGHEHDLFAEQAMQRPGCSAIVNSLQHTLTGKLAAARAALHASLAAVSIAEVLHESKRDAPLCP